MSSTRLISRPTPTMPMMRGRTPRVTTVAMRCRLTFRPTFTTVMAREAAMRTVMTASSPVVARQPLMTEATMTCRRLRHHCPHPRPRPHLRRQKQRQQHLQQQCRRRASAVVAGSPAAVLVAFLPGPAVAGQAGPRLPVVGAARQVGPRPPLAVAVCQVGPRPLAAVAARRAEEARP